ncbi:hypothetical protein QE418_001190 [Microbacterium testaceum]|uniref:DNA/RNA endonuclease G n=1 Tax=Microbacterium TaxID=33882 RepID=UPI00278AD5AD|nr:MULTISPECIES: DNA/RNA endonuclease G [Microbacterium]MDQ1111742.1 hypothetical protein [Microbacterium testaceum]MDR6097721.1 hypothetical protein [Microbacterium sp. SORGH_AS_0454]
MTDTVLRTVVRRETHSPRTTAMLVVVALLIVALAYAAVEIILSLSGAQPLLVAPGEALNAVVAAPTALMPVAFIVGGVVLAVVGLIVLVLALKPGRLSRHEMSWGERAVVVDNGVVASALAQHLSNESGIVREDIVVGVAHRSVDVTVRPPVGIPVDEAQLQRIVDEEVTSYKLSPAVRTHLRVHRPDTEESR